ncbi:MAG: aconitase X [Chloroflexota bacterium]
MTSMAMQLTAEEQDILDGKMGATLQRAMRSVALYGNVFDAERLVPLTGAPHFVMSFGASMIGPYFEMIDQLIAAGLTANEPFTVDPRPMDHANVPTNPLERLVFRFVFGKQQEYEAQLRRLGLKDGNGFTCACYLPEVGNTPRKGDVLAWSESSAVAFANSVLGARTNRNSAGIDILCAVLGKAPLFGLLTDRGRRATWRVEVDTRELPNAQVLGSAIGMRTVEDVPYIVGLDRWLKPGLEALTVDYLKDLGAAAASNGAVGLFHVAGVTPEAREQGKSLLSPDYRTYQIDEAELERVVAGYPLLWKNPAAEPDVCFIGCPHLSLRQIDFWVDALAVALRRAGRTAPRVPTFLCAAPDVLARFQQESGAPQRLRESGARLASLCPLMFLNNPLCARKRVITNSNKLRTYTAARFLLDDDLVETLVGEKKAVEAHYANV